MKRKDPARARRGRSAGIRPSLQKTPQSHRRGRHTAVGSRQAVVDRPATCRPAAQPGPCLSLPQPPTMPRLDTPMQEVSIQQLDDLRVKARYARTVDPQRTSITVPTTLRRPSVLSCPLHA